MNLLAANPVKALKHYVQRAVRRSLQPESGTAHERYHILAPNAEISIQRALAKAACDPRAQLLLNQDKYVLLDKHQHWLMYAPTASYHLVLRGAFGPASSRAEHLQSLLQAFLRETKVALRYPAFYQADENLLAALNALGKKYVAYKLGEEAIVELRHFSLAGPACANLRQNIRKAENSALRFEFYAQADTAILAQCEQISAQWLRSKRAREKQFSLGRFNVEALMGAPLALIYQHDKLIAFANVLLGAEHAVFSVDLMRHTDDAPRGCMDLLFARLLDWGKVQGYDEFSFGMSPLKDVASDTLGHSGHWQKWAAGVANHGERFYNFRGVRQYKQKWQPEWRPRYLLVPARRHALPALLACAIEIAGGHRALVGGSARENV
jgi:phosphatidylglycerol lysyltransferase